MIVYLARAIQAFVMYCVNGTSRSSLLIESTDSMIRQWQYLNQINEFEASTKLQTALQFTYISHNGYFSWCKIVMEAVTLCITIVGKCFNIGQAKSYYTWGNLIEPIMFACCVVEGAKS